MDIFALEAALARAGDDLTECCGRPLHPGQRPHPPGRVGFALGPGAAVGMILDVILGTPLLEQHLYRATLGQVY
jgi:hypothetical protein